MHQILLHFVLRWPMDLFDTTPLGRVLNRFSKDVDVVDNVLPQVIRSWMMMFFAVIQIVLKHIFFFPIFFANIEQFAPFFIRTHTRIENRRLIYYKQK